MQAVLEAGSPLADEVLISMRLVPSLQVVDAFRSFVVVYLTRRFSRQLGDKMGTACHELLENAVNHGAPNTDITVELRSTAGGSLEIWVVNECSEERRTTLHERIQQLVGTNAAELYRMALRGSLGAKSMLGLVRVRHEAGMTIEVASRGTRVMVVARLHTSSQR